MRIASLLLLVLVACGGGQQPAGNGSDLHCTPKAAGDEAACAAKGADCGLDAPLQCYGTDPGDEVREEHRRAYEAGTLPCDCICEQDRIDCSMVP